MCLLGMWKMGGVHETIREMSTLSPNQILQQRVPEERLGVSQALVSHTALIDRGCCNNIITYDCISKAIALLCIAQEH